MAIRAILSATGKVRSPGQVVTSGAAAGPPPPPPGSDLLLHFETSPAVDSSSYANTVDFSTWTPTLDSATGFGKALEYYDGGFTGTGTYGRELTDQWTIDFWCNPFRSTGGSTSTWLYVAGYRTIQIAEAASGDPTAHYMTATFSAPGQSSVVINTPTYDISSGWHYVRATRNGVNVYLYFDGVLCGTGAFGANTVYSGDGNAFDLSYKLFAKIAIDEFRVLSTTATVGDFTPPTTPWTS